MTKSLEATILQECNKIEKDGRIGITSKKIKEMLVAHAEEEISPKISG